MPRATKLNRCLLLLPLAAILLLGSSCQHRGILRCPKPGKQSKVDVKGPNSQSLQGIKVPMDKNGRVQKKKRLFGVF